MPEMPVTPDFDDYEGIASWEKDTINHPEKAGMISSQWCETAAGQNGKPSADDTDIV